MIWTAEPSALGTNHPLRALFRQYGTLVARRPVLLVVTFAAVGAAFCYLFVLLSVQDLSAPPGLPGFASRAWTASPTLSARGGSGKTPEVELRQTWIYGDYMKALDKGFLVDALSVQDTLLGSTSGCAGGNSSKSSVRLNWVADGEPDTNKIFHSPHICWNCTPSNILADPDIPSTISRCSRTISPFGVPLNPSSIFKGAKKKGTKVVAADALIVSLFYRHGSQKAEQIWTNGANTLAETGKYDAYYSSRDGAIPAGGSTLYEFSYRPAATYASLLIPAVASGAVLTYVLSSLPKCGALKSKGGLAVAVVAQTSISSVAAFTIVALRKRNDLQRQSEFRIPAEAYPFVVLVAGLENMFRLLKAVLQTPLEYSLASRIAKALGEVGYLSVITLAQNLVLLYFLSVTASSPEVIAFCSFVATAAVLDLAFHLTFFTAVVSLDLRRLGQVDSIGGSVDMIVELPNGSTGGVMTLGSLGGLKQRLSGYNASLLAPVLRLRTAGAASIICFVVVMNWHFVPKEILSSGQQLAKPIPSTGTGDTIKAWLGASRPSEDSISWLMSQNSAVLKDLVLAIGLQPRRGFVGRLHDPLIFIIKGADRELLPSVHHGQLPIPLSVSHFLSQHRWRLTLCIALTSAITGLLINALLPGGAVDEAMDEFEPKKPLISIQTLGPSHRYDVYMLCASAKGMLASLGLDRQVRVWNLKGDQPGKKSVKSVTINIPSSPSGNGGRIPWPIAAIAIDDQAEWLAICPQSGNVIFWNTGSNRPFIVLSQIAGCGVSYKVVSFFFASRTPYRDDDARIARLMVVRDNGHMTKVGVGKTPTGEVGAFVMAEHNIPPAGNRAPVSSSQPLQSSRMPLRLVSLTRDGSTYVTTKRGGNLWVSEKITWSRVQPTPEMQNMEFVPVRALGMLGLVTSSTSSVVHLLDLQLSALIYDFRLYSPKPHTVRTVHSQRQACISCGASAVSSFSIAYVERETGEFAMHTFTPNAAQLDRGYLICLRAERNPREKRCAGFEKASEKVFRMEMGSGAWEATMFNSFAGIRKCPVPILHGRYERNGSGRRYQPGVGLLRRKSSTNTDSQQPDRRKTSSTASDDAEWEAWTMSSTGDVVTQTLSEPATQGLLVSRAGPVCAVGRKSVAVGFGNVVKIVMLGTETFDDTTEDDFGFQPDVARRLAPTVRRGRTS